MMIEQMRTHLAGKILRSWPQNRMKTVWERVKDAATHPWRENELKSYGNQSDVLLTKVAIQRRSEAKQWRE